MTRRRKYPRRAVRIVFAFAALGVAAAAIAWRVWWQPESTAVYVAPGEPPRPSEDFSASERQSLEDILRRRGSGRTE